jgi:hypothetical protein
MRLAPLGACGPIKSLFGEIKKNSFTGRARLKPGLWSSSLGYAFSERVRSAKSVRLIFGRWLRLRSMLRRLILGGCGEVEIAGERRRGHRGQKTKTKQQSA